MRDLIANLGLGFSVALSLHNVWLAFVGCMVGTLIGVLPGVGPIATITMLLPITFGLPPVGALIMLAGIYYGAQYGGSTTAILVNIPGEVTSVVTTLDGHQMARQGRAGVALGVAALGSFFAGCVATVAIAALAVPLTKLALLFGPAEYASLMTMGLAFAVVLARGSVLKSIGMVLLGLLLSTVGMDLETGVDRMTFGFQPLADGIDFAVLAMGLFGFAEVMRNLDVEKARDVVERAIGRLLPDKEDLRQSSGPIVRGTAVGAILGILPGNGAVLGPFASYALEKKLAKDPRRFGQGAIEGVAGPESANNAGAQTSFIPLLTLGIPPNAVMALMVGAMTIHGIVPGPLVMTRNAPLFWGLIASMWIGNLMLLVINLPLIGMWVRLLKVPYRLLYPTILIFCCIGIYSVNNSPSDVGFTALFALLGYAASKLGFESAPLLLGYVLGRLLEENLRRAQATPDGYTIEMGHMGTHGAAPAVYPGLKYDPVKDFAPIGLAAGTPILIVARKNFPAKDLKEFVAYVKANSTKLNEAHAGVGSVSFTTCTFFNSLLGAKPTRVVYRGTGPALNDLVSGQVDYMCDQIVNLVPQIQAGTIKAYAVALPQRSPAVPDVPTTKEAGLPEFQVSAWNALFAPKGTPPDIIAKLSGALQKALEDENTKKRLLDLGADLSDKAARTPEGLRKLVESEVARWNKVLKDAGVGAQ